MRRRTIPLLLVFIITALLVGHKTASAVYDDTSITIRPSPDSYGSSDEFVRDSIIYLYPRACIYYQTSDGIRSEENQKPGKFHINSIIEGAEKDGWYVSYVQPALAGWGGALSFYFNKNTGKFSCTGDGVKFGNGRWLDLENLSPSPKQPTPEVVAEKTADVYEKAKELLGFKCIDNFKRHLERTPKKLATIFAYIRNGVTGPYACSGGWSSTIEKAKSIAFKSCEKVRSKYEQLSDSPCEVFAIGNKILWKGPTSGTKSPLLMAEGSLCSLAIDSSSDAPKWDSRTRLSMYVKEAKGRKLTVADCSKHLNIKVATPAAPAASATPPRSPSKASMEKRLRELKKLLDGGLITPDEAAQKRKEILQRL